MWLITIFTRAMWHKKRYWIQGVEKMPPPRLQIYLRTRVTLTFDLVTSKVDRFMPLPHEPLVSICINICQFSSKLVYSFWKYLVQKSDSRWLDEPTDWKHYAYACRSDLAEHTKKRNGTRRHIHRVSKKTVHFYRAMHKRGIRRHPVSVRLSVRHIRELRQNE